MQLSIIIINWNSAQYLKNCLRSIFSTLKGISFEVIIIDNASTESFADVKYEFPQARFLENSLNVGFSKANNQGAAIATGEVLLFINPDTIVKDNALNLLYVCIVLQGYAAAGPKLLKKSGEIQWTCARKLFSLSGEFFNLFLLERLFPKNKLFGKNLMTHWDHLSSREVEAISGACIMIRKDFFDKIRGFDEAYFFYGEDVDLCYKILINNQKIYYCSQAEVVHFGQGSSDASSRANILYEVILFNSTYHYFRKNFWGWKFILFNFITICAAIFRIFVILILCPFLGRKRTSDFNKKTLKKYLFMLGIALGIVKNAKLQALFMNRISKLF